MPHLEPERLVLLALGEETLDLRENGHLDTCERCRADVDSLRDVAGLGRQTQRLRELPPPPERVWQRIRAELATPRADTAPATERPATPREDTAPGTERSGTPRADTTPGTERPATLRADTTPGTERSGTPRADTTPATERPTTPEADTPPGGWRWATPPEEALPGETARDSAWDEVVAGAEADGAGTSSSRRTNGPEQNRTARHRADRDRAASEGADRSHAAWDAANRGQAWDEADRGHAAWDGADRDRAAWDAAWDGAALSGEVALAGGATRSGGLTRKGAAALAGGSAQDPGVVLGGRAARHLRRRGPGWGGAVAIAAMAAVVGALAGAGVTVLLLRGRDGGDAAADCRPQDARVRLDPLPEAPRGASGYACVRTVDGERRLIVRAEGMPVQADSDYEAWLLDETGPTGRMEALGVLGKGPNLALAVPATVDLSRYNIIDISAEPHDGKPTHSGRSMLRGKLP
ncbi:anti-sigma factor domain-containing protein [Dactylosporangium sp. NPDC048998]|uniref:anti-sigma factor domain-containing protein n=1 Tax=Dactylosporangium sp. NPDC048998 TaxID=3363976 RepID=UPI003718F375